MSDKQEINWDEPIEVVFFDSGHEDICDAKYLSTINYGRHYVFSYELNSIEYVSTALYNGNSLDNTSFTVRNVKKEPRKFVGYVNVYEDSCYSRVHDSVYDAKVADILIPSMNAIARVKVEATEGQFDD